MVWGKKYAYKRACRSELHLIAVNTTETRDFVKKKVVTAITEHKRTISKLQTNEKDITCSST